MLDKQWIKKDGKEVAVAWSRFYPRMCLEGLRNIIENCVRIAGAATEIRTEHHLNSSVQGVIAVSPRSVKGLESRYRRKKVKSLVKHHLIKAYT
jgi:hypothetical protein